MKQAEVKLSELKTHLEEMFDVLFVQLAKGKSALETFDTGLAEEILQDENVLDNFETKINQECELYLAMYTPVAADLRLIMAINNINPSLERIGDIMEKIGKYVKYYHDPLPQEIEVQFRIDEMYEQIISMFTIVRDAFKKVDTANLKKMFEKDWKINKINKSARETVISLLNEHPKHSAQILNFFLIITKLERIGDLIKNIGEEIIFAKDGKIVRHTIQK